MKTKAIVAKLKDQLEFYFSDSNLWKDKFLRTEISKSPERYVEISILASFKRMKQLTSDIELVVQAIRESDKLELSDNCSGVRRVTPLPPVRNVDDFTVYVEQLPENVDHDILRNAFSMFGGVNYVSLPRFKSTRKIKGFAFIEFDTTIAAKRAAEEFGEEAIAPGENCEDQESCLERGDAADLEDVNLQELPSAASGKSSRKRKREHSVEESRDDTSKEFGGSATQRGAKRRRHESSEALPAEDDGPGPPPCKRKSLGSKDKTVGAEKTQGAANPEKSVESDSKRKKHTRSHTKSRRKKVKQAFGDWRPRVLLKADWMEQKKEYKRLQQQQMGRLKQEIKKLREQNSASSLQGQPTRPAITFKPAVVVQFSWPDGTDTSSWDALSLRELFAHHGNVAFVDFQANNLRGYVRFAEADDCQRALESLLPAPDNCGLAKSIVQEVDSEAMAIRHNPPTDFHLLQGDDEMAYWKRVESDQHRRYAEEKKRKGKQSGQTARVQKKRGRGKLMQKVLKIRLDGQPQGQHVQFDDDKEDEEETKAPANQLHRHIQFDSADDDNDSDQ